MTYETERFDILLHINVSLLVPRLGMLFAVLAIQNCPSRKKLTSRMNRRVILPVLIHLDVGDNNIAGVDSDRNRCTIRLVPLDTIYVNDPFLAVDLCHFALTTSIFATNDSDFIVFSDGKGTALQ